MSDPVHVFAEKTASLSCLPIPKLATYNVRGLSLKTPRGSFILENIKELAKSSDIIALQETHLVSEERALEIKFPAFLFFYDNFTSKARGVVTMVRKSWSLHYNISASGSPDCQKGRSLSLHFDPKDDFPNCQSFTCTNIYASTGNTRQANSERASLFDLLRREVRRNDHYILLGDFNFCVGDRAPQLGDNVVPKGFRHNWEAFTQKANLIETFQPSDTWFSPSDNPSCSHSSRIDRIYISENLYYNNAYDPQANMAFIPFGILGSFRKRGKTKDSFFRSDHHPVELKFFPSSRPPRPSFFIPAEIYKHSKFKELVMDNWNDRTSLPPFVRLANFKKAVKRGVISFRKRKDLVLGHQGILGLTGALNLLREGLKVSPNMNIISNLSAQFPTLSSYLTPTGVLTAELNSHIKKLIANQDMEHIEDPFATPNPFGESLKNLKKMLPASRDKLHQLRAKPGNPPTSDPSEMGLIARNFWSKVWNKRPDAETPSQEEISLYLQDYPGSISTAPKISDIDDIDSIISTNDSAPGPDGIPFAIYRLFSEEIGPVLHDCLLQIAEDEGCPDGFNWGNLHLIPKNNSDVISSTRPISVTNTDNRIIASAIAHSLHGCLDEVISTNQKGFVPGRHGSDHIRRLNSLFYGKKITFALLLDIMKAFDSVDHQYLEAVLKKINMPTWLINAVKALMSNVKVSPVCGNGHGGWIEILRGVKQGCPLSPIIFIIVYEVYFFKLKSHLTSPSSTACAFADDVLLTTHRLEDFYSIHKEVSRFEFIGGCRTHPGKSLFVCNKTNDSPLRNWINNQTFWDKNCVRNRATYLGVLFGKNISLDDIYKKSMEKFHKRLLDYRPIIKNTTMNKRMIIINTFCLPVFSYLHQFYMMDSPIYERIQSSIQKAIIPLGGSAYKYPHLIAPKSWFGFANPIKDVWATNLVRLIAESDLSPLDGIKEDSLPQLWLSSKDMCMEFHKKLAVQELIFLYFKAGFTNFPSAAFSTNHKVYNFLKDEGYKSNRNLDFRRKLSNFGKKKQRGSLTEDLVVEGLENYTDHILKIGKRLKGRINTYDLAHHNHLLLNGITTNTRLRWSKPSIDVSCKFCESGLDHVLHIYGDCPVVSHARNLFDQKSKLGLSKISARSTFHLSLLATDSFLSFELIKGILSFNAQIWRSRCNSKSFPIVTPRELNQIVSSALHGSSTSLSHPGYSVFGNSKNRTKEQAADATAYIENQIENLPDDCTLFFTDGSAVPNPGPSGAGVLCSDRLRSGNPPLPGSFYSALGYGSNNLGEMWAIGMCLQLINNGYYGSPDREIHIFSDCSWTIKILLNKSRPHHDKDSPLFLVTRSIKRKLRETRLKHKICFHWTPGHADVSGNVEADRLASLGSSLSTSQADSLTPNLAILASKGLFISDHLLSRKVNPPPYPTSTTTNYSWDGWNTTSSLSPLDPFAFFPPSDNSDLPSANQTAPSYQTGLNMPTPKDKKNRERNRRPDPPPSPPPPEEPSRIISGPRRSGSFLKQSLDSCKASPNNPAPPNPRKERNYLPLSDSPAPKMGINLGQWIGGASIGDILHWLGCKDPPLTNPSTIISYIKNQLPIFVGQAYILT